MQGNFSRSRLVGLIHAWVRADPHGEDTGWVAQMASWLGPMDAIRLQAACQPSLVVEGGNRDPRRTAKAAVPLQESLASTRTILMHSISQSAERLAAQANSASFSPSQPPQDATQELAAYKQHFLELQRRMETLIDPLRAHCRQVLSQSSPALARLAELDAAMEQILADRAKDLLARLPRVLEQRLRKHASGADAQGWGISPAVLQEWQELLIAELDFRLEPVAGLVEAYQDRNQTRYE